jgi:hypothetical protein
MMDRGAARPCIAAALSFSFPAMDGMVATTPAVGGRNSNNHRPPSCAAIRSFGASADRHGTTILCVRKNDQVCMMGGGMDGLAG